MKRKIIQMAEISHYERSVGSKQWTTLCFVLHRNTHSVQMKV